MNTPVSRPSTSASALSTANGENQDSSGVIAPPLTSATMPKTSSAPTWAKIRIRWNRAEISVPITQTAVMAAMITIAKIVTAVLSSRSESSVNRSNV